MAAPFNPFTPDESQPLPYAGPERRSGRERRQDSNPTPPAGLGERRMSVRRKADRLALERGIRFDGGVGGRGYPRVHIEVPVLYRLLPAGSVLDQPARRGMTRTLAPGGLGILLEEGFRVGTFLELLLRLEGDLVAVDVQVVSVLPQGGKFLHNCRFTRLGTADRTWVSEYLRLRDGPSAENAPPD